MKSDLNTIDLAIRELIAEMTDLDRPVKPEDQLIDDLALSSIDMVEMSTMLRLKFDIELSPQELSSCDLFGDLLSLCVARHLNSSGVSRRE